MNKEHIELFTDYLLSTFGYAIATGLSRMVEGQVAHDQLTRFLSAEEFTSFHNDLLKSLQLASRSILAFCRNGCERQAIF